MVRDSDSGGLEEINSTTMGPDKGIMGLNGVNDVPTDDLHLRLSNSNGNGIKCDKKKARLDIDLNEVVDEQHELDLNDTVSMPDDEVLGVQKVGGVLSDSDKDKHKLDLASSDVGGVLSDSDKDKNIVDLASNDAGSAIVLSDFADGKNAEGSADANIDTNIVTYGRKHRSGRVSEKERESASTTEDLVAASAEFGMDTTVLKKKKRGRPPKEIKVESTADDKVGVSSGDDAVTGTGVGAGRSGIGVGKPGKRKGKVASTYIEKTVVKTEHDIDTIVQKKRGRPPKKSASAGNESDIVTSVSTSGPKIYFGKVPKSKGEGTSTFKKKTVVNADIENIVPNRKRGRPPYKSRVESNVEEKVRVCGGVKKGGDVDNTRDEENNEDAVAVMPASLSGREMRRRKKHDYTELMECSDDAADSELGNKHENEHKSEKGRRGTKRKMLESSVHELDCEVVGRSLRSRAVPPSDDERNGKNGLLSNKTNEKMKEESGHFSVREEEKRKGLRGRPAKVPEKSELLKMTDGEKRKRSGLRGTGLKTVSKEVNKGSKVGDTAEQKKEIGYSDAKGDKSGTQKKLLKERIKDMLIKSGWTIELRPRRGKENVFDKVYVNTEGRGYWSVTLAYKMLKEEIESGKASSTAHKAYFPIAEDDWNSLLRISNKKSGGEKKKSKKSKEVKDQSSKVISRNKKLKKKNARDKLHLGLKLKASVKRSNSKEKKNKKRFTLLARGSKKGSDSKDEDFLLYEGQRSLLSWMVDLGTVPLGSKVKCLTLNNRKVLREGRVTKDGIECDCCTNALSLSDFDRHAGNSLGLPLRGICLDPEISLLQCLSDTWSKYAESITLGFHSVPVPAGDPNDDTCNMCGDGGKLICCDSCPSAIHQKCLNIQNFPSGEWNCIYCCCKFCGIFGERTVDEDQKCDKSVPALPTCPLCEEKYHPVCAQAMASEKEPDSHEFCSQTCQQIMNQFKALHGVKHQLEEGFTWTIIQYSNDNLDISSLTGGRNVEANAKLAIAWSIMDECFLPIVDQRSGINIIRNVVHSCGSNIRRLNYTGFFIAILERGDEIISAASLRIHGNLLAEMPFVGTRHAYRRQGMCRRLLNAVETALSTMNVEKLVLPAIPDMKETWRNIFGFMPVEDSLKKRMQCMNIIAFPGVDMLQKPVSKPLIDVKSAETAEVNLENPATVIVDEVEANDDTGSAHLANLDAPSEPLGQVI